MPAGLTSPVMPVGSCGPQVLVSTVVVDDVNLTTKVSHGMAKPLLCAYDFMLCASNGL